MNEETKIEDLNEQISEMKGQIARLPVTSKGAKRFPRPLREAVLEVLDRWLENGGTMGELARALEMNRATLHRWYQIVMKTRTQDYELMRRVRLVAADKAKSIHIGTDSSRTATMTTEIRIEGLEMDELFDVLDTLSEPTSR